MTIEEMKAKAKELGINIPDYEEEKKKFIESIMKGQEFEDIKQRELFRQFISDIYDQVSKEQSNTLVNLIFNPGAEWQAERERMNQGEIK